MMVNEVVKRGTCSVGKHTLTENKAAAGVVGSQWYLGTYLQPCHPTPGHLIKSNLVTWESGAMLIWLRHYVHFVAGNFQRGYLWVCYHKSCLA